MWMATGWPSWCPGAPSPRRPACRPGRSSCSRSAPRPPCFLHRETKTFTSVCHDVIGQNVTCYILLRLTLSQTVLSLYMACHRRVCQRRVCHCRSSHDMLSHDTSYRKMYCHDMTCHYLAFHDAAPPPSHIQFALRSRTVLPKIVRCLPLRPVLEL